jgi:lactoylglutathione lyase
MSVEFGYRIYYAGGVEATIEFFERAFGRRKRFVTPGGDYREPSAGQTTLAFAGARLAAGNLADAWGFAPLEPDAQPIATAISLVTRDVPAAVAAAQDAGAKRVVPVTDRPGEQTVAYVRDPNGILIEVATQMGAASLTRLRPPPSRSPSPVRG